MAGSGGLLLQVLVSLSLLIFCAAFCPSGFNLKPPPPRMPLRQATRTSAPKVRTAPRAALGEAVEAASAVAGNQAVLEIWASAAVIAGGAAAVLGAAPRFITSLSSRIDYHIDDPAGETQSEVRAELKRRNEGRLHTVNLNRRSS